MSSISGDRRDGVDRSTFDGDASEVTAVGADGTVDEPFTRYQNPIYRMISMGGAALVAVLGITGFAIGRTVDPSPPPPFYFVDAILTVVLFGWLLLGMRCRLDLAETWVHVATKYGDFRLDRDRVESVELDLSVRGSLQLSGRPLIIRYRCEETGDEMKSRKAYGCLPSDVQTQRRAIGDLQAALGRPAEVDPRDLAVAVADHLAGKAPAVEQTDLAAAVAARLATMEPEGDQVDR